MGSGNDNSDGLERLGTALDLYARWNDSEGQSWEQFLSQNKDYRDLLEQVADGYRDAQDTVAPQASGQDSPQTLIGQHLGDFRIVREIGRGGMGVVYEAEQRSLERRVALKVLAGDQIVDPVWIARFKREAATIAKLNHRGIISVLAVGHDRGRHYFAMELITGASLSKVLELIRGKELASLTGSSVAMAIEESALDGPGIVRSADSTDSSKSRVWQRGYVESLVEMAAQVAEALQHTHESGVVHRDVKPGNILLRVDGHAVLTDFGLAREDSLPSMTQTGQFAGTPYYVSPEQALARLKHLDHRTDIYSLGATLYELATLKRPFDAPSTHEILQQITAGNPIDPQKVNRHLPADLAAIILKSMEKSPAHRYQSAAEMAADLRAFLNYRPIAARRPHPLQRLARWARREPMRAALVSVMAISVPLVTGLSGYAFAKQAAIEVGEGAILTRKLDKIFERASIVMESFKFGEARDLLQTVLDLDPENTEAIAGIAHYIHRDHDWTKAGRVAAHKKSLAFLDTFPRVVAGSATLGRIRAQLLNELGKTEEAKAVTDNVGPLRTPFDYYNASRRMSLIATERNQQDGLDKARDLALIAVVNATQSRPIYHFNLARAAKRASDFKTVDSITQSIRHLWPESEVARFWVATYTIRHKPAEAMQTFEELAVEAAIPGSELAWMKPHLQFQMGFIKEKLNDPSGAATLYGQALEHMPEKSECRYLLARSLLAAGDSQRAEEHLREGIRRHPKHYKNYVLLNHILAAKGKLEAALEIAEAGLEQSPGHPQMMVSKGMTLGRMQRLDESSAILDQALKIAPDNRFALHNRATLFAKQEDYESARDLFVRAAELQQNSGAAWFSAGLCDLHLKEHPRATRCFRRALQQEPRHSASHRELVKVLRLQGREEEAEEELRRYKSAATTNSLDIIVPIK